MNHQRESVWDYLNRMEREALIRAGKCVSCKGRGWHVGECHPQETCGACDGSGAAEPPRESKGTVER